jgi:hypothetical protein
MVESLGYQLGCQHLEFESYNPSINGTSKGIVNMGGVASGCTGPWTPCYLW